MEPNRERNTPQYKHARAELLRDQPTCHWCRRAEATELDHLVESDSGGTISEGFVPACKPCNSRRGAEYINKKSAKRIHDRKMILLPPEIKPPSPMLVSIPTGLNQPEPAEINHDQPRLETIVPDCDGSWGSLVGDMALELLHIELMPWQVHCLERMLGFTHAPDGQDDLVHRSSLVSVARQNGKTVLIQCLILFWLLEMPRIRGTKQTILSTAHTLTLGTLLFEELAPTLERLGATIYKSYGRNSATMPDGSRWMVRAANPSIGHGMSVDLICADEIFDISEIAMAGLIPTQRVRRSPLLAMFSTAGTESSLLFIRHRENALRLIDTNNPSNFYFAEWSPPPTVDPMLESSFGWGNPALGHTLTMDTLRAESKDPDRSNFLRSSLNMWIASTQSWIQTHLWPDLKYDGPIPSGGVISVEASMDESRYFATKSVALGDGRTCVSVAFTAETAKELWAYVGALAAADPAIKFIFSPTIDAHCPPIFERRRVVMGYKEILQYTPIVRNMISEGRIVHTGEAMLAEHVCRAVMVRTQGSIAVSSQKSAGPIELCRTMIWGAAAAARPANSQKPSMILIAN